MLTHMMCLGHCAVVLRKERGFGVSACLQGRREVAVMGLALVVFLWWSDGLMYTCTDAVTTRVVGITHTFCLSRRNTFPLFLCCHI